MITKDEIIEIGKFQKTHALKGELNALLDVDFDYVEDGNPLVLDVDGIFVPFYADSVRPKDAESALVKLKGIDSQEEAKAFVNKVIYGLRKDLVDYYDVPEEELVSDFMDFIIYDEMSGEIGKVRDIDDTTANVLFVVGRPDGSTALIPVAEEFITKIDTEKKVIYTSLPEGLIDI